MFFHSQCEYFRLAAAPLTAVKASQQETCMARYYYAYSLQPLCFFTAASCPPSSCHPCPPRSHDLHPLSSLFSSPPSRSWSYRSTGPTLHRLACDGTLQTCWPSSVIGTSYVPQHATWPSTCWTCSWTTTMWLLSSSTWSPCLACS